MKCAFRWFILCNYCLLLLRAQMRWCYWSQTGDGQICQAQTIAKVSCKLHSLWL